MIFNVSSTLGDFCFTATRKSHAKTDISTIRSLADR
jgi:hypothetical protein